jgi:hypothetical protein
VVVVVPNSIACKDLYCDAVWLVGDEENEGVDDDGEDEHSFGFSESSGEFAPRPLCAMPHYSNLHVRMTVVSILLPCR